MSDAAPPPIVSCRGRTQSLASSILTPSFRSGCFNAGANAAVLYRSVSLDPFVVDLGPSFSSLERHANRVDIPVNLNVDFAGFFGAFHDEVKTGLGVTPHQVGDDPVRFQVVVHFDF